MNGRLAIVGASARAAAASAIRAGFQVTAADLFADEDLRRVAPAEKISLYPGGLSHWLRALEPRPEAWMYTGALENHPDLVEEMAAECPLWGNVGAVLREVRSPWRLAQTLRDAGKLFPDIRATPDGLPLDGSWLAKTGRGAGGSGVRPLSPCLPVSLSPCPFFQRRVTGTPCSAVFVAAGGSCQLLGVVRQLIGEDWLAAREFQYCGAIGPWPVTDRVHDEIAAIGSILAHRFSLVGLFGVDFVIDGEQLWTIEVNPRYTASVEVVERASGVRAIAAHVAACMDGELSTPRIESAYGSFGKAILFAERPVSVSAPFVTWALAEGQKQGPWPRIADIPSPETAIERGHPILTVFADGSTFDETIAETKIRVATISRRLYFN